MSMSARRLKGCYSVSFMHQADEQQTATCAPEEGEEQHHLWVNASRDVAAAWSPAKSATNLAGRLADCSLCCQAQAQVLGS